LDVGSFSWEGIPAIVNSKVDEQVSAPAWILHGEFCLLAASGGIQELREEFTIGSS
jgi:hypothetical protein